MVKFSEVMHSHLKVKYDNVIYRAVAVLSGLVVSWLRVFKCNRVAVKLSIVLLVKGSVTSCFVKYSIGSVLESQVSFWLCDALSLVV